MIKEFILKTEEETFTFGKNLAACLPEGGFVALYGDLGCGKSVLARGIGAYLGISNITSPTFTILQRYDSSPVFYHIDAYRLRSEDELFDIGFEECLTSHCIVALEWADIVPMALPENRIDIYLDGNGMGARKVRVVCPDDLLPEVLFLNL